MQNDVSTDLEDFDNEGLEDDDSDGAESADATTEGSESDDPELEAAEQTAEEADRALKELKERRHRDSQIQARRELRSPEAVEQFLAAAFRSESDREAFENEFQGIEDEETVNAIIEKRDIEALRESPAEIQDRFVERTKESDPELYREWISKRSEKRVSALTAEPAEDGTEPEPFDADAVYGAIWRDSDLRPVTDLEQYVEELRADAKRGVVNLDAAGQQQFDELVARANKVSKTHPKREALLEPIAGLGIYARAETEKARPFGLGGVRITRDYMKPDGSFVRVETDGFGQVRETAIDHGKAPSELGLLKEEPAPTSEPFNPESITSLDQARKLSPVEWASLPAEKREQLLREASARQEEIDSLSMRRGSL